MGTALPIDSWSHSNLDSCDIWSEHDGAGTLLFSVDCNLEYDFGKGQVFNFNESSVYGDVVSSGCDHGFYLGMDGEGKGLLTSEGANFGEIACLDRECGVVTTILTTTEEITTEAATTMEEITCENVGCSHACFYNGENLPE